MQEATVRLLCPRCTKDWSSKVSTLPGNGAEFDCPDCSLSTTIEEFFRTARDLEIWQDFSD